MYFPVGALLVSIMKSIDDALANGHTDAVTIFFAKTGSLSDAETHLLGKVYAFYLGLQCGFQLLGFWRHPCPWKMLSAKVRALIRNIARKHKSMERLGPVGAVEGAVLNAFAKVASFDIFGSVEVSNGAGYFQNAVVGTGG